MRYLAAILAAALLAVAAPLPASAQGGQNCAQQAVASGQILPLGAILANVRARVPGRLVGVNLLGCPYGPFVYRLRMLTSSGRVAIVTANARSGQILGVRGAGRVYNRGTGTGTYPRAYPRRTYPPRTSPRRVKPRRFVPRRYAPRRRTRPWYRRRN